MTKAGYYFGAALTGQMVARELQGDAIIIFLWVALVVWIIKTLVKG